MSSASRLLLRDIKPLSY